jgi:hypothetical protein
MNITLVIKVLHIVCEEDVDKQEMGMKMDFSNEIPEEYTLYSIDYTSRYDSKRAIVSSAGLDFIVNESYESVNARIEERRTFSFN